MNSESNHYSQQNFLRFAFEREALKFGEFKTKSGRLSPYFFNAGGLYNGSDLNALASAYASVIYDNFGGEIDMIFGPAYKGITLAALICAELQRTYGLDIAYGFNRKEAKDHGEKGLFVGKAPQAGDRLIIVDDVITAGTAIRETMDLLGGIQGLQIKGIVVAIDRMEKATGKDLSAVQEVKQQYDIPVVSITSIQGILDHLNDGTFGDLSDDLCQKIHAYRREYGV
jgi:orotate phosphoribosyltransferase